jgi:hypothetical protein
MLNQHRVKIKLSAPFFSILVNFIILSLAM